MADGTIQIDVEIPVNKVKSDAQEIDNILQKVGKDSGNKLDESFNKNAEKVKRKAKETSKAIDNSLGKNHKTKIIADNSDAKKKANETKRDLDKVPKERKIKYSGDNRDATKKADETKRKTREVPTKHNTDFNAEDHTGGVFSRIKAHFDSVNKQGEKTHSLFRTIFSANIISNAALGAFGAVKNAIGGVVGEAKQYALDQQTMNATWLTLTNNAGKGRAMVKQINDMAAAAQNSTHMVDQLSQKFYAINNSAKQTGELTKAVLTLQDAFGQSDAAVENFGTQFAQMMANGKVSAQDMMSIVNTFPKLKPMLLDYERQVHHSSDMTMAEMSNLMSKGEIKSQDMINVVLKAGQKFKNATGNFTATIPGMIRTVRTQMPRFLQAFEKPLTKAKNPFYAAVSKWATSSQTEKEFGRIGKTVSSGMEQVTKALSGGKAVNVTKTLNDALEGLNKSLKGVFGWLADHAKDLRDIGKDLGSIAFQIGKSVWKDFASILSTVAQALGLAGKNADKSGGSIHVIAEALNNLAKNKTAIKVISDAIVAMAVAKGLDSVGGSLFAIGEKGYGAWKKLKALGAGMKGLELAEDATKAEKGWARAGGIITKAFGGIKKGLGGLVSGFKRLGRGIATASKELGGKFVQQLKLVGKGVKGLGKGILNAAKAIGREAASAGKFLGEQLTKGFKASVKFGKGLFGKGNGAGALNGLLQSARSAGGFKNLSTAGKIGTGLAGAGVAIDAGSQFLNAYKDRHSADKRSVDIGKGIGAGIGGGIGLWFGGPLGAAVGAQIGKAVGGWGGQAVNKFTKGWQRNKPPKKFWSLGNLGYSAHSMWNGFTKGVSNTIKWFKKNWKEVGLYFVSPIAGAINSLYKHNTKFRKWVNGLVKSFKKAWKGITKWFSKLGKDIQKSWKGMVKWFTNLGKNMVKGLKSGWHGVVKWFTDIAKGIQKGWHNMTAWFTRLGKSMASGLKSAWHKVTSFFTGIAKGVQKGWNGMTKWFTNLGNGMVKGLKSGWHGIVTWFSNIADNIVKVFKPAIDTFNAVKDFATGKLKIGNLHLANGTDWRKKFGYPAILNDGHDSPETGNVEGVLNTDGTVEPVRGVNTPRWILPGQEVINARDMARIFGHGFVHRAGGSVRLDSSFVRENRDLLRTISDSLDDNLAISINSYNKNRKKDEETKRRNNEKDHRDRENARNLKVIAEDKKQTDKVKKNVVVATSSKNRKNSKSHKGQTLVDTALLRGSLKPSGNYQWVNDKLFSRLMSYSKVSLPKLSKNSRIRYREIPVKSAGKGLVKVDTSWLEGLKHATGKYATLNHEEYLRLLNATKAERKYKIKKTKKKKKTKTRKRSIRRSSSTSTGTTRRTSVASISGLSRISSSIGSTKGSTAKVVAKVSGLKSVKALTKAIKAVKNKKVKVTAKISGLSNTKKLSSAFKSLRKNSRSAAKALKAIRSSTRSASSGVKSLTGHVKSLRSQISKLYSAAKKNKFGKIIKAQAEEAVKSLKGKGNFAKTFESLTKKFKKDLEAMHKNAEKTFKAMWSSLQKESKSGESHIEKDVSAFGSKLKKAFSSIQSGISKSFNQFWSVMKKNARSGLNDVIGVLNQGISRINGVVADFGGNKSAVHQVRRLATGTGALSGVRRPITAPTLAILNDGFDSPETGNKETIWDTRNNTFGVVQGRNTPFLLQPGQEVLNASESKMLGFTNFATGTGALKQLYEQAKKYWKQPANTGKAQFGDVNGLNGAINDIAQGANKLATKQAVNWWSQLWSMVQNKVNDGSGDVSGLLKEAVKVSKGHRYVWGAKGPDVFDCSGLVQYAASKLGITLTAPSGNQYAQVEHIPRSKIRQNDLVFYGPGGNEHVGIVRDKNTYWSAHSPSSHPNIGYDSIDSAPAHPILFGRIRGYKPKDDKGDDVKADTKLQKQIKGQVGKGFWQTIKKIADKFGDTSLPNVTGSAKAWTSYIKRAAEKMHVNLTSGDLAQILRVIQGESGGNPKSINLWDSNARAGHPSKGIIQFIDSTFDHYAMPGHHNIWNGYDQLLAMFNDATWRRDLTTGGWGPTGPRRFARGGIVSKPETVQVAEAGHPETIIPWDPSQRERAYSLMQATLDNFRATDGKPQQFNNQAQNVDLTATNKAIDAISQKFDNVLDELGILSNKSEVIKADLVIDRQKFGQAVWTVTKPRMYRSYQAERSNYSGI